MTKLRSHRFVIVLLSLAPSVAWGQGSVCPSWGEPGQWSVAATDLSSPSKDLFCTNENLRDIRVYSPDHKMALHIVGDHWWVEIGKQQILLQRTRARVSYPSEVAWAPDGKAFYITHSDGSIAGFLTEIYRVADNQVEQMPDINRAVQHDFDRRHKCVVSQNGRDIVGHANIAALGWADGSSQILVVAEAPPNNFCNQSSYFEGFLLSLPGGEILKRYTPQALVHGWSKMLGDRLTGDFTAINGRGLAKRK